MHAATSEAIKQHIKRSYLHCYHWLHAPDYTIVKLDHLKYGYSLEENGILAPVISSLPACPAGFPLPCKYAKCQQSNFCPCHQGTIRGCSFRKLCHNPSNI